MGKRRNKEQTIARLIAAVGCILAGKGHRGIGINRIAAEAGVSKPMIYDYFGGLKNLLKAYIHQKDYWLPYFENLALPEESELKDVLIKTLQEQFRYFKNEPEMQKIILWQISEANPLMRAVSESREAEGIKLLALADDHFKDSGYSIKAVIALLVGGIYYNVFHNAAETGTVAGIDLSNEKEYELMISTVAQLIELVWQAAGNNKQK